MLWLNESLNLLFFESRYPRSFAIAVVASLLGFKVPYMLAADVLCMAVASVATLVRRHTTATQSVQSSLLQLFAASAKPTGLCVYLYSWHLPVAKSVWYEVLLILLTCNCNAPRKTCFSLCLGKRIALLANRESWERQSYRESYAT